MDPLAIRAYFDGRTASVEAKKDKVARQEEARSAEIRRSSEDGFAALNNVVIPYLEGVAAEFPDGQLVVNTAYQVDAEHGHITAVSFRIAQGPTYIIQLAAGRVGLVVHKGDPPPSSWPAYVMPANTRPFING